MLQSHLSLLPLLFLCVFLQIALPLLLGYLYGAGLRAPEAERRALSYEFGICNTALAALLALHHIGPLAAVPAVANLITNTCVGSLLAVTWQPLFARRRLKEKQG
jgi:BASS family bile acid:Na+ symporter